FFLVFHHDARPRPCRYLSPFPLSPPPPPPPPTLAMPRSTLPLSERVQNMVLCAMDRASYKPSKLPRISDTTTRTSPMTEDLNLAYLGIGTLVFDTLAHKVLHGLPGLELPASHDLACQTLKSPRTCARILLATTGYQDVAGCPFIGMDAPELADALLRFFGMFTAASGKKGLFRLRPWFEHAYKNLAVAAAKAMDPNALIRIPKYPTKFSDLRLPAPKVQKKVPKITTILTVEKKALVDITNSEDGVRGAGRSSRKKKSSARPAPYPTPYVKTEPDALLASIPSRSTEPSSIAGTLVISAPTSHADPQSIKPSTTLATNLVPIFSVPPPPPSCSNYPPASFLRTLAPTSLHATTRWQRSAPRNKQASPPRAPPHAFPVVGFVWSSAPSNFAVKEKYGARHYTGRSHINQGTLLRPQPPIPGTRVGPILFFSISSFSTKNVPRHRPPVLVVSVSTILSCTVVASPQVLFGGPLDQQSQRHVVSASGFSEVRLALRLSDFASYLDVNDSGNLFGTAVPRR
ncbi:hypothetical protein B0H11DRAFT_2357894, partial [Mycena galericulata]